jgi:hypothetical protein
MEKAHWGQAEQNRISRCLRSFGWLRIQVRTGDKREWRYRRPVTEGHETGDETEHQANVTTLQLVTSNDR